LENQAAAAIARLRPQREKEIFERLARNNRGPLENEALRRLFERILDESRRVERVVLEEQS
jgi:chorismate mutase